nr:hypothetical protein GCM10020092_067400 [Actinoplanes digitatis]
MHRVAIEVEGGDPAAAVDAAYPLCQRPVPNRERMSYLWVDVGRAFEQLDRRPEAIEAFRRAERAAPLRVRLSPVVSRCVSELLDKSHRRAAAPTCAASPNGAASSATPDLHGDVASQATQGRHADTPWFAARHRRSSCRAARPSEGRRRGWRAIR